jgi:hypothetical protein
MIPLRSIPALAVALAVLAFAAWAEVVSVRQSGIYADDGPAPAHAPHHAHAATY